MTRKRSLQSPPGLDAMGLTAFGDMLVADAAGKFPAIDGVVPTRDHGWLFRQRKASRENGVYTVAQMGDAGRPWVLARAGTKPQTFRRLAVALGWVRAEASPRAQQSAGRRLRRYVEARSPRVVLRPGRSRSSPYLSTLAAVRQACPELVDRRARLEEILRRELGGMGERLDALEARIAPLEASRR